MGHLRIDLILFAFLATAILMIGPVAAGPTAPTANFTMTVTGGPPPLTVQFLDTSTGFPTGFAWYFGDEPYTASWTQTVSSAGWSARYTHSSVVLPDGSIVLMGGYDGVLKNDVWRSTDQGATWTRMTANATWSARQAPASVVLLDGSIVLMGGYDGAWKNDVWRSTDKGATWTRLTADADWPGRAYHTCAAMPDGDIVLMGGYNGSNLNDFVWRSTDGGATWTQVNVSAGPSARRGHTSVVLPDGSIVLMGGYDGAWKNDVWRSTDQGATWTRMTASAGWSGRMNHNSVAMPDGSTVLTGGNAGTTWYNDVWRSIDCGATWTKLANGGWSARNGHSGVGMPDGGIVLMGGYGGSVKNDVWRLPTAGSTERNPSHTYTVPGTYDVSLTASNAGGSDTAAIPDCIAVDYSLPVANFTATPRSGTAPLLVQFADTSTGDPRNWSWKFGDGATSTAQSPTHSYTAAGNYTVNLTVTNARGSDSEVRTDYITVTGAATPTSTPTVTPIPTSTTAPLPAPRHIFITPANGVKYDLDGAKYGTGNNGTYYIKADGGGLNELHISTDPVNAPYGQVTTTNATSGTFWLTNTGGRGFDDDVVLLVSVQGEIPDDFGVRIKSSGYTWTPGTVVNQAPDPVTYVPVGIDETFTKEDFAYGPQTWKPGPGDLVTPSLPLWAGQNIADPSTASHLLFVDLKVGNIYPGKVPAAGSPIEGGGAKVEFSFTNMPSTAAFNAYGWCLAANQAQGISWTNDPFAPDASGFTVVSAASPVTPTVSGTPTPTPTVSGTVTVTPTSSVTPVTGPMPASKNVNLWVSNDAGARYDDYGNDTYHFFNPDQSPSQGINSLKLTTNPNDTSLGQVVFTPNRTGTFYIFDTSGRGWDDDNLLLLAVNGTVPDDFRVRIRARGYQWTPVAGNTYPLPGALTYNTSALDETFTKDDLVYGPQTWKPCSAPNYPLFEGQDTTDTANTFTIMLIDLNVGGIGRATLAKPEYQGVPLTDSGMARVDYTLENLPALAAFSGYAYSRDSNLGHGVLWTNTINGLIVSAIASGYYVTTPAVGQVPGGTGLPADTDGDGLYDDVNGNGRRDFGDVVLYFNQMTWIAANEPMAAFDCNGNGRIDFADVVWLFNHI
jgi:PKD repeat protein